MAAITAAMVKELRVKTDAPMMECKKAACPFISLARSYSNAATP